MYLIKVNTGDAILTYSFQNTSSGKYGDDGLGISLFISAFKKQFKDHTLPASMIIMNEFGLYYSPAQNKYIHTDDYKEITIKLNSVKA